MTAVQGRVQLLLTPAALPGNCVICGSVGGDGRRFIDFGWQQDFYGAIYFCEMCITEVMDALGFVREDIYNNLKSENENLKTSLEQANRNVETLRETIKNVFAVDSGHPSVSDYTSVVRDLPNNREVPEAKSDNNIDADESNSNANEHGSVEESRDIRKSTARTSKSGKSAEPLVEF